MNWNLNQIHQRKCPVRGDYTNKIYILLPIFHKTNQKTTQHWQNQIKKYRDLTNIKDDVFFVLSKVHHFRRLNSYIIVYFEYILIL